MSKKLFRTSAVALALVLAGPALAQSQAGQARTSQNPTGQTQTGQTQAAQPQGQGGDVQVLTDWNQADLYRTGLRADALLDADVVGPGGDEIGSVENAIIDQNNKIVAIIAQVGGFLDIGDTHVVVPWNEVELLENDVVRIPVTEDTVENYGLFGENSVITKSMAQNIQRVDDDAGTGPRTWKLTNLIDDYATLRGQGYGYVEDAIFTRDGTLKAVIVEPSGAAWGAGPYAYPFRAGGAWNARDDVYDLPYDQNEVAEMEPFDFDEMADWDLLD